MHHSIHDSATPSRNVVKMTAPILTTHFVRTFQNEGPSNRSAFNGERTSERPTANHLKQACRF